MSVWMQRAQRPDFPSLNTDALALGPEGPAPEPASCLCHSAACVARSKRGSTLLIPPQCPRVHSETRREGEGSRVKGQPFSQHVSYFAKPPSDLGHQRDRKPGLILSSPFAAQRQGAFPSQAYFSLSQSVNECSPMCS